MNYLQKEATLNKLAQINHAACYILRQRAMQKKAWGDPTLDKYYDANGNRNWMGFWSGVPATKPKPQVHPDGTVSFGGYTFNPANDTLHSQNLRPDQPLRTAGTGVLVGGSGGAFGGALVGGHAGGVGIVPGAVIGGVGGGVLGGIGGAAKGYYDMARAKGYMDYRRGYERAYGTPKYKSEALLPPIKE